MKTNTQWKASDTSAAKYLGTLEIEGAPSPFEVLSLPDRLLFGGACNAGFLESGYILRDELEGEAETLAELVAELETFYRDGRAYTSRVVCNERM